MARFVTGRDVTFFKGINNELLDKIIETPIIFYSLIRDDQTINLYGETIDKLFAPGLIINALIDHPDETTEEDERGPNVYQTLTCAIYRNTLKEKDFYPERGDYIRWKTGYYEIDSVVDNQLLAGRVGIAHSIICTCVWVDQSVINIRGEV